MDGFPIYPISIYLGIAGFLLLVFVFLTGMHVIKFKHRHKWHRYIGIAGFSMASIHALVMLYFFFFA